MDASEFSKALDKALGLCRAAAELKLPIEAMLEHVDRLTDERFDRPYDTDRENELEALRSIVEAVGAVAAIGSALPPAAPDLAALPCPLPANLRSA